jgi:hypothetical protein
MNDNQVKPEGANCPRCAGLYVWNGWAHSCLNCGFVYNPRVVIAPVIRSQCTWGSCRSKIYTERSKIYCEIHYLNALKQGRARRGIPDTGPPAGKGSRKNPRFEVRNEDLKREAWPIAVRLKPRYRTKS